MTVAQFQVSEFQIATDTTNIDWACYSHITYIIAGILGFKNTYVLCWHVNIPIPETYILH
jgi:hypothetical protein